MKYTKRHCINSDFCRGFSNVLNLFGSSNGKDYEKELIRIQSKYNNGIAKDVTDNWMIVRDTLKEVMNEIKEEIERKDQ